MKSSAYTERLLDAPDVCKSCLRIIRIERVDPARSETDADGKLRDIETMYERDPTTTEVAYGPADSVGEQKGVFCAECGTEGAHDDFWRDDDVDDERFRELVQHAIATLEEKGVTLSRQDFARHALYQRHRQEEDVDKALSEATKAAIVAEVASDSDGPEREHA